MTDEVPMIRILLADDHVLVRQAIGLLLSLEEDFEVVAYAGDGEEALDACEHYRPHIVLMDQWMPRMNGLEATRLLKDRYPDTLVVILTSDPSTEIADRAREVGADGHLYKLVSDNRAIHVIRSVLSGEKVFEMSQEATGPTEEAFPELLSQREMDVLRMVSSGYTNRRIASEMHVSLGSVKTYVQRILAKLSVSNRTEAVVKARNNGMI